MPMIILFLKKTPFLRLVFPLIIGIYFADSFTFSSSYLLISTILLLLCYIGFYLWVEQKLLYRFRYFPGVSGFIILLLTGAMYLQLRRPSVIDSNRRVIAKVELTGAVGHTEKNYKYEVYLRRVEDSLSSFTGRKRIVYLSKDTCKAQPDIGDSFFLQGRFIAFSKPDHHLSFDYGNYLRNHRIAYRIIADKYEICLPNENGLSGIILIAKFKRYLLNTFKNYGLTDEETALLDALYLGDKSQLRNEQKDAFSGAGAMHLLAVSGLHIGIIYLMLVSFVKAFNLKKNSVALSGIVIAVLWIYALITGFSPSVLRASIMFTILEIGRLAQLKTNIFNLLGASMFIILLIEPLSVFNIGFWLSHCAVASIVCFYPKINNWFYFRFPPFRWLWSVLAVTLAAQIGALPISIFAFHEFPLYFLVSNILLIPIVSPLLIMAVSASLFSFSPHILELLVPALGNGLSYMEQVAAQINDLPRATVTNLFLYRWQLVFIYTSIILLIIAIEYRYSGYLRNFLFSLFILIGSFYLSSSLRPSKALFVANIKGKSVVNYIGNESNEIYSCSPLSDKEIEFAFKGIWAYCGAASDYSLTLMTKTAEIKPVCKQINGAYILIVPPSVQWVDTINAATIDKLIVMNQPQMTLEQISGTMRINELVVPGAWNSFRKNRWLKGYSKYVGKLHDVYTDGVLFVSSR